jgi:hypothetical protein
MYKKRNVGCVHNIKNLDLNFVIFALFIYACYVTYNVYVKNITIFSVKILSYNIEIFIHILVAAFQKNKTDKINVLKTVRQCP